MSSQQLQKILGGNFIAE